MVDKKLKNLVYLYGVFEDLKEDGTDKLIVEEMQRIDGRIPGNVFEIMQFSLWKLWMQESPKEDQSEQNGKRKIFRGGDDADK